MELETTHQYKGYTFIKKEDGYLVIGLGLPVEGVKMFELEHCMEYIDILVRDFKEVEFSVIGYIHLLKDKIVGASSNMADVEDMIFMIGSKIIRPSFLKENPDYEYVGYKKIGFTVRDINIMVFKKK